MTSWRPLVPILALFLVGCGDEEAPSSETSSPEAPSAAVETAPELEASAPDAPAAEPAEEASRSAAEGDSPGPQPASDETLGGEVAGDVLDEGAPPSPDAADDEVERILEETERRFQEASQTIEQQYEQAERESRPEGGVEAGGDPSTSMELEAALEEESPALEGEAALETDPEVEAILEETERRFEEARRKIDEQFEQAERSVPSEIRETTTVEEVPEEQPSEEEASSP
ncbi:hypothetical protein [Halomonas beimenensis]|uniref:Uncharacterized protein n=1 Tax=Halomonas beimenensis TaxID=475662 RepID=A0A291P4K5_9GAMM|nr:hypothetical protein [Halomonas beimenensis]ATJ81810.1 hypothetical protein BEI_0823 [Halomonas beimenensis]